MTLQSTRTEHAVSVGANHDLADLGVRELVTVLARSRTTCGGSRSWCAATG
jgi:hypothetical protein